MFTGFDSVSGLQRCCTKHLSRLADHFVVIVSAVCYSVDVLETHRYPGTGVLKCGAHGIGLACPVSTTLGSGAANGKTDIVIDIQMRSGQGGGRVGSIKCPGCGRDDRWRDSVVEPQTSCVIGTRLVDSERDLQLGLRTLRAGHRLVGHDVVLMVELVMLKWI